MSQSAKPVIGWREWVGLPDLSHASIKAKVDTGARSSALHAYDLDIYRRRGVDLVRFKVHPYQRDSQCTITAERKLIEQRWIKASSGQQSLRPVILEPIRLMGQHWQIELTLVNRDTMGFRMLLGRRAVRKRFLIDPGRSFLGGKGPDARRKQGSAGRTRSRTKSS